MTVPTTSLPETADVLPAHRFDERRLEEYLTSHVEGFTGPLTVRQFRGGQSNPTYHLIAGDKEYVLRRKPPGKLLPSAHAVDREYRAMSALQGTGVPVPRTYVLCEDARVTGTMFYVMSYVPGRVFRDPSAPGFTAAERGAIFDDMNGALARLHRVDRQAVGLESFGRPGNYFTRQIHRWSEQYRASETEQIEAMGRLMEWLPTHIPEADETTIVHGDYRLGNLIIHPTQPKIAAVLDWELSTLGHPLADLGYNCMMYHFGEGFGASEGYAGVDLKAFGIPTEQEYLAAYARRTKRQEIPNWNFFVAFSLFRLAAIVQGVYKRGLDGNASSETAKQYGNRARVLADLAWSLAQKGA